MAIKYFCDCCGKELVVGEITSRFRRKRKLPRTSILIEVVVAVGNVWNGGHVCHACIMDIVMNGETLAHYEQNKQSNLRSEQERVDEDEES